MARDLFEEAIASKREPIYLHNLGIVHWICNNREEALRYLNEALEEARQNQRWMDEAMFMLIANDEGNRFIVDKDLPICIGILMSLYKLSGITESQLRTIVSAAFVNDRQTDRWIKHILNTGKE